SRTTKNVGAEGAKGRLMLPECMQTAEEWMPFEDAALAEQQLLARAEHRSATEYADESPSARKPKRRLRADSIAEFLAREIPEREMLLLPIIARQGLVMLFSWRGIGKTHTAIGIAYAVATGGTFLRWRAPKPARVLYIDGEMPAKAMQERIAAVVQAAEGQPP